MKIIKYHYVRDISQSKYPNLKSLDLKKFIYQLNYLKSNFNILTPTEAKIKLIKNDIDENDCWLTFDDGYIDHIQYVHPILKENMIKASFYPTINSTLKKQLLDVNKIHIILASCTNHELILEDIKNYYKKLDIDNLHTPVENILIGLNTIHRYDNPLTIKIKRLLQFALPIKIREEICNLLMSKYVVEDQKTILSNFYMSLDNLKELYDYGHEIGIHGCNHQRWGTLNFNDQFNEICKSFDYLKDNQLLKDDFSCCYPWGSYNNVTLDILKNINCTVALTSIPNLNNLNEFHIYKLPRLDTNDFPQSNLDTET